MAYVKQNYGETNAETSQKRKSEILSALRNAYETEKSEWAFRGLWSFSAKKILLSFMCELEKEPEKQEHFQHESEETLERFMRELRMEFILTSPSHRPKLQEQFAGEYTDSLQALSRFLAHYCEKAWERNCRDYARSINWECGIERLASGVPRRVDRLKGLGNAIVPQIAELLWRQIKPYLYGETK